MKKFILTFIVVIEILFFTHLNCVEAIALQTLKIEQDVVPGGQIATVIKLFNDQEARLIIYPSIEGFTDSGDESGNPTFMSIDNDINDLPNWIIFNEEKYVIPVGEKIEVPIVIDIPKNAEPGGHYATIFFSSVPTGLDNGTVQLGSRIGTLVILDVEGEVYEEVNLLSFQTKNEQKFFNHLPVIFETRLENKGNVHVKPIGSIIIKNIFGMIAVELELNSQDGNILPKTIRKYSDIWIKDDRNLENEGFLGRLSMEWNNFALGYYRASVEMEVGRNIKHNLEASYGFWVWPWRVLLIVVVLLIVLLLIFKIYHQWIVGLAYQKAKKDLKTKRKKK